MTYVVSTCHLVVHCVAAKLRGGGWVGFTIQHYFQGLRSHLQKHDQQFPKNQCRLTHDLINFELTHVPTMIFFSSAFGGGFEKWNG